MSQQPETSSSRRPTLAVATIGHHRHGKTTLTSAITRVLAARAGAELRSAADLDREGGSPPLVLDGDRLRPRPDLVRGEAATLTVMPPTVHYTTERRVFFHVDSPGRRPWLKNAARAQALADALIVVVSATDSVQAQTHEHLLLARALGHTQLAVFLNKCDAVQDAEWIDLVERDVRELLGRCGFDGDATPIVRGAALPASLGDPAWTPGIDDLIAALEEVPLPPRRRDGPPLLYVHRVYSQRSRAGEVIVEGRVRRGSLRRGDPLALLGEVPTALVGRELKVVDLELQRRKLERAEAGDFVGLLLGGASELSRWSVRSGTALLPFGARASGRLVAQLELLAPADGGRPSAVRDGHSALFLFGTAVMSGRVRAPQGQPLAPGASAIVELELRAPIYAEPGTRFAIRDGNQGAWTRGAPARWAGLSGAGEVLEVLPQVTT